MESIFEALRDGDTSIVGVFVEANAYWLDILNDIDSISVKELAKRLEVKQMHFESIAGERYLGKILLGLSGFTHLYSCQEGFGDNLHKARKLRDAFASSFCSLEVKHTVLDVVKIYGIDDYD